MKYAMMLGVMLCMGCSYITALGQTELQRAINFGAEGKITFRVVDSAGSPVEGAAVKTVFIKSQKQDYTICEGLTDTNGLFVSEGKSYCDMNYRMSKDGYYQTDGRHFFYSDTPDCVENGRWQPWNPTNTVVLKEKRNPISMYAKKVKAEFPVQGKPIGFDFEVGDWVKPYGSGDVADICFSYEAEVVDNFTGTYNFGIICTNRMDGLFRAKKDLYSELLSIQMAPENGYVQRIDCCYDRAYDKVFKEERVGKDEYLIFRSRTELDEEGNIKTCRYGKIYGRIGFGKTGKIKENRGIVLFTYYLNPTDNDRNLEFDPQKNLLEPSESFFEVYKP